LTISTTEDFVEYNFKKLGSNAITSGAQLTAT